MHTYLSRTFRCVCTVLVLLLAANDSRLLAVGAEDIEPLAIGSAAPGF